MSKKEDSPPPRAAYVGGLDLEAVSLEQLQGLANILLTHGHGAASTLGTFQDVSATKDFNLDQFRGNTPVLKLLQHPIKGTIDKSKAMFPLAVGGQKGVTDGPQPVSGVEIKLRLARVDKSWALTASNFG